MNRKMADDGILIDLTPKLTGYRQPEGWRGRGIERELQAGLPSKQVYIESIELGGGSPAAGNLNSEVAPGGSMAHGCLLRSTETL